MPSDPLRFGGEEIFAVPPERLFAVLTDLDALARGIPDLVSSRRVDDRTLECVVRPGFSFLRGTLRVSMTLGDLHPPASAAMHLAVKGIGTQIVVQSGLRIESTADGSRLTWTAEVTELKGLVATVSRPLISAAAEQVIRQAWQQIRDQLAK